MVKLVRGVTVCFQGLGQFVWMVGNVFELVWMKMHEWIELWDSNCSLCPVFAVLWCFCEWRDMEGDRLVFQLSYVIWKVYNNFA